MGKSFRSRTLHTSLLQEQVQVKTSSGATFTPTPVIFFTNICDFYNSILFSKVLVNFTFTFNRKMKYFCVIVTAMLAVLLSVTSKRVMGQPVSCSYGSPDNRKLCAALASLYALPNSVEAYPNPIRPSFEYLPPEYKGRINEFLENNLPGTKRQDVDHVFLRFGRRR